MKEDLYITKNGVLLRRHSTLRFVSKEVKRVIPIERTRSIYALGHLTLTSGVIHLLAQKRIPVHFFNHYGYYEASLLPREKLVAGHVIVQQAAHYLDPKKRLILAKAIVTGAGYNLLTILHYHRKQKRPVEEQIEGIHTHLSRMDQAQTIPHLMSIEGAIWDTFYQALPILLPAPFTFDGRTRRPPTNPVNSLISFGNSLLYATILTQIYHTQLHPAISYLHEPHARRYSLALDISEIFKPIIVCRLILTLLNRRILTPKHFDQQLNACLLTPKGRQLFLQHYHNRLNTTLRHPKLKRHVSYQHLIRLECYKLIKHIIGDQPYQPYRAKQ